MRFAPDWVALCQRWGLWRVCLSLPAHYNVGIFAAALCVGVIQLVSGFISEGIALRVAIHLVHLWEEGRSGASMVAIVVLPLTSYKR